MTNISTSTYEKLNEEAEVKQTAPLLFSYGTSAWKEYESRLAKEKGGCLSVLRSEFWMWIVIGVSYGVGASITGSIIDGKWSTFGTKFLRETISMITACIFMRICIRMIELKPCLSACGNEVLPIFSFTLGFVLSSATCTSIFEGKWDYLKDANFVYLAQAFVFVFLFRQSARQQSARERQKSKPEQQLSADLVEEGESNSASS